ncbi:MAG: hypothetical protein QXG00_05625 [Candidatus Woesearchaeota archaeon]
MEKSQDFNDNDDTRLESETSRTIHDEDFDFDKYNRLKEVFVDAIDNQGYGSTEIKKIISRIHNSASEADIKNTDNKCMRMLKQA